MRKFQIFATSFFLAVQWVPVNAADAIGGFGKWSMFRETTDRGLECWIATGVSSKGAVRRSIQLYATKRLKEPTEISVLVSNAIQNVRQVHLIVDGKKFRLYRRGNAAWPKRSDEKLIIQALKQAEAKGKTAIRIEWGSRFKWPLSVQGFSRAFQKNIQSCSNG